MQHDQNKILTIASYHDVAKAAIGCGPDTFERHSDYVELVRQTRAAFEGMGLTAKLAVEAAYIFSRKVPTNEQQDVFQELITAILASGTTDAAFAYTIARRDVQDWWRQYKRHSQYYEGYLSDVVTNAEDEATELAELLVGEVEFERKMISKLDARRLWRQLPENIKPLILKRLQGKPLGTNRKVGKPKSNGTISDTERKRLNRWVQSEGFKLLIN